MSGITKMRNIFTLIGQARQHLLGRPMIEGIQIENGKYGRCAVITAAWSSEMLEYILSNRIVEIELNHGKGWRGNDITFLSNFDNLKSLNIIDLKLTSVAPIHNLKELVELEVITYCKTPINFLTFPRLEECALEWRPKADSLFDCATIKRLFVNRYDGKDTSLFGRLINLESLAILNAPVEDLQGLSGLGKLRSLRLANLKRVKTLAGIEELKNLEELTIDTCRFINSISEIGHLKNLRRLHLSNDGVIESLSPLDNLEKLESIVFDESTNILDGDLSTLLRQKALSRVAFQNRRHYSHRWEEFGVAYTG